MTLGIGLIGVTGFKIQITTPGSESSAAGTKLDKLKEINSPANGYTYTMTKNLKKSKELAKLFFAKDSGASYRANGFGLYVDALYHLKKGIITVLSREEHEAVQSLLDMTSRVAKLSCDSQLSAI